MLRGFVYACHSLVQAGHFTDSGIHISDSFLGKLVGAFAASVIFLDLGGNNSYSRSKMLYLRSLLCSALRERLRAGWYLIRARCYLICGSVYLSDSLDKLAVDIFYITKQLFKVSDVIFRSRIRIYPEIAVRHSLKDAPDITDHIVKTFNYCMGSHSKPSRLVLPVYLGYTALQIAACKLFDPFSA